MTNGEARLRELVAKLRKSADDYYEQFDKTQDRFFSGGSSVRDEDADLLEQALAAPVQSEVESRSVQRRKALQRGELMPTFEASVQAEVGAGGRGTIQWWIARCYEAENKLEALRLAAVDKSK